MIARENIIEKFAGLRVWGRGDQRAPHKPLLALLALADCAAGRSRLMPFTEVEPRLTRLLEEFGPSRRSVHPEYPFWRLQTDGIWEIPEAGNIIVGPSGDPSKASLVNAKARGGLKEDIFNTLVKHPELISFIAKDLLTQHFPDSCHEDILLACGFPADEDIPAAVQRKRDPEFRFRILSLYQAKCAVCGFDLRLGNNSICLEAAHIKWHQAGGPNIEQNGLALCSMHHKMFDRGAFTIEHDMSIKVSEYVAGNYGLEEWLMRFSGQKLQLPRSSNYFPDVKFLQWHFKEVFRDYVPAKAGDDMLAGKGKSLPEEPRI